MVFAHGAQQRLLVMEKRPEQDKKMKSTSEDDIRLHRWLVSFASDREWYPVGEYVAVDAESAIERAVEVFGAAADYRAEEIPWDAAPLVKPRPGEKKA